MPGGGGLEQVAITARNLPFAAFNAITARKW
jgi:hypothetical protein